MHPRGQHEYPLTEAGEYCECDIRGVKVRACGIRGCIISIRRSFESNMSAHGKPYEGMECLATMDDITEEEGNYCEYQTAPSGTWRPALFAAEIVQQLLDTQFHTYIKKVQEADCKAELRRLVTKGPPVWLEDKHALPLPEGETHITKVWFAKDDEEKSAKLDGAVEGDEREKLWSELKELLEAAEDDEEVVR